MRLIDADELKKSAIPCQIHNGALTDLCVPLYQIDNAPTVEPDMDFAKECYANGYEDGKNERPQGEWTDLSTDGRHMGWIACSVCGQEPPNESNLRTDFCPNCGANMRGGAE